MMKKIWDTLTATWLMGTLLIFLATVLGVATFIEKDFGPNAARALVYNTWWFEAVFSILLVNMIGSLLKFKAWTFKKLPVLAFHLAFVFIILGAALTRYFSFEGLMHIREGETSDVIWSSDQYVRIGNGDEIKDTKVLFSLVSPYDYAQSISTPSGTITVESTLFVPNAISKPIEKPGGSEALELIISNDQNRREVTIFKGDDLLMDGIRIGFETFPFEDFDIHVCMLNGIPHFSSNKKISKLNMLTKSLADLPGDSLLLLEPSVLYQVGDYRLVLKRYLQSAVLEPVQVSENEMSGLSEAIQLKAELNGDVKSFFIFGNQGVLGKKYKQTIGGEEFYVSYGAKEIKIPFSLRLNKFEMERYPGSESPSSFASEVTLHDHQNDFSTDYRIFMNNILNYSGYRFFQSSYDSDEKGTVLSVNYDWWGTLLTYVGYFILSLGMFAALIVPHTRFRFLIKRTNEIYKQKKALVGILVIVLSVTTLRAEVQPPVPVGIEEANAFGKLIVQDNSGRIKPLNTMNSEVLVKLVKHHTFKGLSADQVMLGMMINPNYWMQVPMITIKHPELKSQLAISGKKAAFKDFFTANGQFKIRQLVENAHRKTPAHRDKLEQELVKVDEQLNVFYMARLGSFLRIFPHPKDRLAKWQSPSSVIAGYPSEDSLFVSNIFGLYIDALAQKNTEQANEYLNSISKYQYKYGAEILPSAFKRDLEIWYNKSALFMTLSPYFLLLGILLLIFNLIRLVKPQRQFKWILRIGLTLVILAFFCYTLGLGIRWYISGHAPWSNGYESMLYIGWSTVLAGLVFSHKSPIALALSSFLAGIDLMVAHLSWMNPEITNLVPVLKSYWLTIHVAVIVASYGFLALSALIGFLNLVLIGVKTPATQKHFELTIEELSAVSEMAMTVGLYLLTIGSFLGGVWANESWGRYWGWDPKETWSAVTILIYAFVLHMRYIPGLKGLTNFNFWSLVSFASVIMTYLGVNYYLSGMHSYAKGDAVPVPSFVFYAIAIVAVVSIYAFYNDRKQRGGSVSS